MTDLMVAYAEKCRLMSFPVHDGDGLRVDPEAGWEAPHAVLGNPLLGTSLDAEVKDPSPRGWMDGPNGEGTDDAAAIQAAINAATAPRGEKC